MGSPLEVSNIEVIFSVQGDPVWTTLPPGTPSVRFEQNFVEGIMSFTFSESKIVVKSLFLFLCTGGSHSYQYVRVSFFLASFVWC